MGRAAAATHWPAAVSVGGSRDNLQPPGMLLLPVTTPTGHLHHPPSMIFLLKPISYMCELGAVCAKLNLIMLYCVNI